ncbi:MAG: DNA polymerase III subunit delta [Anaerolineae bacterium]|jgi:DNA polymerase-3 subunit delta
MTKPKPTFYVFHGEDEFTRSETLADFKRRLGPPDMVDLNTTVLDGKRTTLADLRHTCDAVPFLTEKRLVIVRGLLTMLSSRKGQEPSEAQRRFVSDLAGYLPHLPPTTRLVFVEKSTLPSSHPIVELARREQRGYVRRFDRPDARALPRWIKKRLQKHGGRIEPRAAHRLAALVGADLRLLDQEIVKLVTYTNAERLITETDVETLVPYSQNAIIFDLVDALGQRDGRTAAETLHRLLEEGEHPLGLLGMIVRQFRLLVQVKALKAKGASSRDIAKALKIHPFPAGKLHRQATRFTAAQLEKVYRHLSEIDVEIKTGKIDAELALDLLVAGLATTEQ